MKESQPIRRFFRWETVGTALFLVMAVPFTASGQILPFPLERRPEPRREAPEPPPVDEAKKDFDLSVPIGEFFQMRPESGLPIKEAFVDRDKVIKIFSFTKNAPQVKLIGVGLGDARVILVDTKNESKIYRIRVTPSIDFLQHVINRQFPQSQLKLTAIGDDAIVVDGNVDSPSHVDDVIKILKTSMGRRGEIISNIRLAGATQVQLSICIARVDRSELRRLNSNILTSSRSSSGVESFFGTQLGNLIGVPGITVGAGPKVFDPGKVLTSQSDAFFGVTNDSSAIFVFLDALKQNGVAKVLANPTLVTTNGKPAEFIVGGDQPIPTVVSTNSATQSTVTFRKFGTSLSFVPVLMGDGKIRLDVLPEISTVNFANGVNASGLTVPQFLIQRLHTTVEMESGQTLYLGGLLQTQIEADVQRFPVLGDIPWVGAAFRRVSHVNRETELVVIVTPRLIQPLRECQRPPIVPGQETRTPTDYELFLRGRIEMSPPPPSHLEHRHKLPFAPNVPIPPMEPVNDPYRGPVFGPFGPAESAPVSPDAFGNGPVFGPFGPKAPHWKAPAPATGQSKLALPGPTHLPVSYAVYETVGGARPPAPLQEKR